MIVGQDHLIKEIERIFEIFKLPFRKNWNCNGKVNS